MPTVIDSLSIEIQSNSTSAATGIEALATALGKLKQNGAVGVAVKNLNGLSGALKNMTSAASNANKISSLADAMEKLKNVGSAGSGVKKLAESLQSLSGINYSAIDTAANSGEKFTKLAAALSVLSEVKAGGIGSMVNGLAKIGDVTKKLDDATINAFVERVKTLSDQLAPLSEKMTTIKDAFSGVNAVWKQTNTTGGRSSGIVSDNVFNMSNLANVLSKVKNAMQAVIQKFSKFISAAIEWDGISDRFGRGFGVRAQETYDWLKRLNKEMGINTQQFMQYASTYATMLTGFGVAQEDASKMALGYMELTYDVWAGYNDQYKSLEDAADAIRSAIAGEIKAVRKMGMTIVDSQLEATAANYGIAYSTQSATEELKSYLRYLTMVDQAYAQGLVGTYAREMNTAEGVMRTFNQQLKSLTQSFGSLFLPVLVRVVPYFQAFVDLLSDAVYRFAELTGVTIQAIDWDNSFSGITGSAEEATEAVKELKNATLGIDELNVIGDSSDSDSGLAGMPDVSSLWDESIFKNINNKVDEIKEKFGGLLSTVIYVGETLLAWGFAAVFLKNLGKVQTLIADIKNGVTTTATKSLGIALVITGITLAVDGAYDLGYSGPTLENVLKTAIGSALGIAGSLLFFGTNPTGWAVGIGLALTVAVTSIIRGMTKAREDMRSEIIESLLFDGKGIDIGEVVINATASIGNITAQYKPALDSISIIQDNQKVAEDFAAAYNNLFSGIQSGVRDAKATLPELTQAFKDMYNNTVETLNAQHDLVLHSLSGATGEALKEAGLDLLEIKDAFNRVHENMITDLDSYNKEYDRIASELENGTLTAGEACEQLEAARKQYSVVLDAVNNHGTKTVNEFAGTIYGVFDKVKYESATDVINAFKNIGAAADTAVDSIKTYYEQQNAHQAGLLDVARGKGLLDEAAAIEATMQANVTAMNKAIDEVVAVYQGKIDEVFANLFQGLPEVANKAFEDYDSLSWFMQGTIKKEDYVKDAVEQYRDEIITPVTDGIKSALGEELTAKADLWGEKVLDDFLGEAFKTSVTQDAWGVTTSATTIAEDFKAALDSVLSSRMTDAGKNGVLGVKDGIDNNAYLATDAANKAGAGVSQALADGISDNSFVATNAVTNLASSIGSAWNSAISQISFNLPTVSGVISPTMARVMNGVGQFASGGFPSTGQMFVAREAGPELVGSINGRTAVANNDQIVEAVSQGVYEAVVAAMNANRGSGDQNLNVYLDGKQIYASVKKTESERGRSLMGNQLGYVF